MTPYTRFMPHRDPSHESFKVLTISWSGLLASGGYALYRKWIKDRQTYIPYVIWNIFYALLMRKLDNFCFFLHKPIVDAINNHSKPLLGFSVQWHKHGLTTQTKQGEESRESWVLQQTCCHSAKLVHLDLWVDVLENYLAEKKAILLFSNGCAPCHKIELAPYSLSLSS